MSIDLDIVPTVQKTLYWKDICAHLETLLGSSSSKFLGEQPRLQHMPTHIVVREDEALAPSNYYAFDLAIPTTLMLGIPKNEDTHFKYGLPDGFSNEQECLEGYLEDFGHNLAPETISRLAASWCVIGYYYGLDTTMGRSREEELLFVCLAVILAEMCEGYVISMGDYGYIEKVSGLGVGVYRAEEFRRVISYFERRL